MTEGTRRIARGFIDLAHGQVHWRGAGDGGVPLLMLHKSPFSAASLAPLITRLAATRRVLAPDLPGNGDSDPMPQAEPGVSDYADAVLGCLDVLGIDQVDVYGAHSGARIAVEVALAQPTRVRRLVLDGFGLRAMTDEAALARHAPSVALDTQGQALMWLWHFVRDQHVFAPWYAQDAAHRRPRGLPDAATLHDRFVETAKATTTYHLLYRAALRHDMAGRVVQVTQPMLVLYARDDSVFNQFAAAKALLPHAEAHATDSAETDAAADATAALLTTFLVDRSIAA